MSDNNKNVWFTYKDENGKLVSIHMPNLFNRLEEARTKIKELEQKFINGDLNLYKKIEALEKTISSHHDISLVQTKEISELRQKVANPEWLDILILDLMKPMREKVEALELKFNNSPSLFNMENKISELRDIVKRVWNFTKGESSAVTIEGLGNSKRKIPHESSADSKPLSKAEQTIFDEVVRKVEKSKPLMVKMDEDTVFDLREPIPTDSKPSCIYCGRELIIYKDIWICGHGCSKKALEPSEKLDKYVAGMRAKERAYEEGSARQTGGLMCKNWNYVDNSCVSDGKFSFPYDVLMRKEDLKKLFDWCQKFLPHTNGWREHYNELREQYLSEEHDE